MTCMIRNPKLADEGNRKIDWVIARMPVLSGIEKEFIDKKPFEGMKISLSIHLEAKTAYLAKVLKSGGAHMRVTGSNPLSTQDEIAAALAAEGIEVFAWHGATPEEYKEHIKKTVEFGPNIVIDDGGDLVNILHGDMKHLAANVMGGCEETTTGVLRLRALEREGKLLFPMFAVNDADCKHLFDNKYGTGQSVWDGIMRTTNLNIAGRDIVIAGYGWCGKGVATRAAGLGGRVIITETNPIRACEAVMDGFRVMPMEQAASEGDVFITVTGCKDVITTRHFKKMKNGAILCNAGHFNVEIDMESLGEIATNKIQRRKNITGYVLPGGNEIQVLGEGRLVNLACGDGHPVEIMDMSFSIQAMCAAFITQESEKLEKKVLSVPKHIDDYVAWGTLKAMNVQIDVLSKEQKNYLEGRTS